MLKTKIHYYYVYLNDHDSNKKYDEIVKLARSVSIRENKVEFLSQPHNRRKTAEAEIVEDIELSIDYLFSNQWNSDKGRVFDWVEFIHNNDAVKEGHFLEVTDEMRRIRDNSYKCGYCGKIYRASDDGKPDLEFCTECMSSKYLEEYNLYLLMLVPVSQELTANRKLLYEEFHKKNMLIDMYKKAQEARKKKEKGRKIVSMFDDLKLVLCSKLTEILYKSWLLAYDMGSDAERMIYYPHTKKVVFGWNKPYSKQEAERLAADLKNHGFPDEGVTSVEIKQEPKEN